jgi:hypothetical protein
MATLKEFEDALRQHGMANALAILDDLKKRDREKRSVAPARRVVGRKMTADLARTILEMHATTGMTQQEIAFKLGVNQGRVNEVIKRGKWLNGDPGSPEALSRDKAMERLAQRAKARRAAPAAQPTPIVHQVQIASRTPTQPSKVTPERLCAKPAVAPRSENKKAAILREATCDVEPELALAKPDQVQPRSQLSSAANSIRRPPEATSAIVSAQLAFLDL